MKKIILEKIKKQKRKQQEMKKIIREIKKNKKKQEMKKII